jgi:hypothetical protein
MVFHQNRSKKSVMFLYQNIQECDHIVVFLNVLTWTQEKIFLSNLAYEKWYLFYGYYLAVEKFN